MKAFQLPRLTPQQIAREREDVRACIRYARSQSKSAVYYRRLAADETNPDRATRYARYAAAYQSGAWWYLNHAKARNV